MECLELFVASNRGISNGKVDLFQGQRYSASPLLLGEFL